MPEETIWKGRPSQWKNKWHYATLLLSIPLAIVLQTKWFPVAGWWNYLIVLAFGWRSLWEWIKVRATVFQLTSERLVKVRGVQDWTKRGDHNLHTEEKKLEALGLFTKVTDSLELYRVRDLRVVEPLFHRLLGLQNIEVITSDSLNPELVLEYVPAREKLLEQLRHYVETCRQAKGARVLDAVQQFPGDAAHDPRDEHSPH